MRFGNMRFLRYSTLTMAVAAPLVLSSLAVGQDPSLEGLTVGAATQPAGLGLNDRLTDTQRERYITALTAARRERPAASVALRRDLNMAIADVNQRMLAVADQSRRQIAAAQTGRDTANASRRGGKGWYGGHMEQMYDQRLKREQQQSQVEQLQLTRERAMLTAQLGRLDALDRLHAAISEENVHTEYGQMGAAEMAGRRADGEYRQTALATATGGRFGQQLFTVATGIRKEYEKLRGLDVGTTQPSDAETRPAK